MTNSWFRMYADFIHNPKVQIVTEALRYRYVALLCLHCNGDYENRPDDEIALSLRVTVEEWIFTRDEFVKRQLLTEDLKIYGWEKKQYISDIKDPTAAMRQKRYREGKRNNRNATVTSRLPEADTDTDKKDSEAKASSSKEPEGVTVISWKAFLELRKKKKATNTEYAISLIFTELKKLKEQGFSPQAVIDQSLRSGWIDVYKLKENFHANTGRNPTPTKTERLKAAALRAARAGGYAPEQCDSQERTDGDALSVFSIA